MKPVRQSPTFSLQQTQRLLITPKMEQALSVLKMPLCELANWVSEQILENPLLEEISSPPEIRLSIPEVPAEISLYEHLLRQVALGDFDRDEEEIAHLIIGNLNPRGFLDLPLEEVATKHPLKKVKGVLEKVQELDPPGIGAKNLAESLLIQLKQKGKAASVSYTLIQTHFEDLLHKRWGKIQKGLSLSRERVEEVVQEEIAPLDFAPGSCFLKGSWQPLLPDVVVEEKKGVLQVDVNQEGIPSFEISSHYDHYVSQGASSRFIGRQLKAAEWIGQVVNGRKEILQGITQLLLEREAAFFCGEGNLVHRTTLREIAQMMGRAESTIARAIEGKTLLCPRGLFPFRLFFSSTLATTSGEQISCESAKALLKEIIAKENKKAPLSDVQLAKELNHKGVVCARRTISKYRRGLKIPSARLRKN